MDQVEVQDLDLDLDRVARGRRGRRQVKQLQLVERGKHAVEVKCQRTTSFDHAIKNGCYTRMCSEAALLKRKKDRRAAKKKKKIIVIQC